MEEKTQLSSPGAGEQRGPMTPAAPGSVPSVRSRLTWVSRAARAEKASLVVLSILTDALLYWLALNLATLTRLHSLIYADLWLLQRDRLICTGFFVAIAAGFGVYRSARLTDRFDSAYYCWLALLWTGMLQLVALAAVDETARAISIRESLIGNVVAAVLLGAWRYRAASAVSRLAGMRRRFHVLGDRAEGMRIAREIRENEEVRTGARYCSVEVLRRIRERGRTITPRAHPTEAIIVLSADRRNDTLDLVESCLSSYDRIFLYPTVEDTCFFPVAKLSAVAGIPLVELGLRRPTTPYVLFKRVMDIAAATIGLALAIPVCVVAAVAVRLTSPGPVLYTQERMGRNGRVFNLYKLRTMVPDAEAGTGPIWAQTNDHRVTPVGRFLRRHRIDEIPQLFNVLKGDMSLIGPRPERPHFHEEFRRKWPLFDKRLLVRPGVTSLSHVLGSYNSDPRDRLRYDLMYINSLSFMTDLKILLSTVRVVLGAKGAQ